MFKKILIANRGEIACRIIWTCKELGIKTVAVYSEADEEALHVRFADEAIRIGPPNPRQSYLSMPAIISAAEITNVDAIHPGYGFLAENARFAEICESCNIRFIGPTPHAIRTMGDKAAARKSMIEAGVPVVPGSEGIIESVEEAQRTGDEVGYPLMLKASAGGGGRGMRIVHDSKDVVGAYEAASNEALGAFGDGSMYMERYVGDARHIEIQVVADSHGNVVHLGERECSVQRRHQKLIEESPSPALTPAEREAMGNAAVAACKHIGYESLGTIEFLYDRGRHEFYFMEMNTRIQVEHPVTEMVTNSDLVRAQILIAAGDPLNFKQEDVTFTGHSIECRVNAEDPRTFAPSPGKITALNMPGGPGVRVDTHAYAGYTVPPHYDSLVAKIITHARTRDRAIARMQRALEATIIEGIKTSIPLHMQILADEQFQSGDISTRFMETFFDR
ncbi:MAG: acetyl-CoA carboxylase biotin carboxylase subunit [Blastocatellia bacterium]|jgi:acetyl-CoA carboxylase biotin carboxylase subunit|nr:acetyl-CoA carboxylase biotin carboxylase subunit [Blastocatellia bacterium]